MKLAVIIGSTRQGRVTSSQANWVYRVAQEIGLEDTELIDLADYPMPFFNEPLSPRYNNARKIDLVARKWLTKLESFDAYIFVTPEYNHSIPAVLKNAIDYVTWEIQRKPVAVISHGANGGARAATDLKEILSESRAAVIPSSSALAISGVSEKIDEEGNLNEEAKSNPYGPENALKALLKEIKWYSDALERAKGKIEPGLETASMPKTFAMI